MKRMGAKKWFQRKAYGWGWVPATWQGWMVIALYIIFLVWDYVRLNTLSFTNEDSIQRYVVDVTIAAFVLVIICFVTGETPRWQWGEKHSR